MADTDTTQTNGTAETPKVDSILTTINQEWVKAGRKTPDAKALKAMASTLKAADDSVDTAQKALALAKERQDAAVLALAKATGGAPISIGGEVRTFAARNGRVFFRSQKTEGVVTID
jgi:hypothetical protein